MASGLTVKLTIQPDALHAEPTGQLRSIGYASVGGFSDALDQNLTSESVVMAAAWHGGLEEGEQFVKNTTIHDKISLAMDYWFGRDLTNLACLNDGGTPACPCDNPGNLLWYVMF
jgi:hypothetical protein